MAVLPSGFVESAVAGGLVNPTAMEFSPDNLLYVAEQGGTMPIFGAGGRVSENFFRDAPIAVDPSGERGLLGVAFDPGYDTNRFVYIYYTATTPVVHNRVSRFTADTSGTHALAGSEFILLDIDTLSTATNHNGGAIHFGPDGKLYIAVGDNAAGSSSQTLTNLKGKILRLNPDGSIPSDNPFFSSASGKNRAIWALGLRNPFTFAFQPGTGRMFINDVGQVTFEEIDQGAPGANYGWPTTEGPTTDPRFVGPFYSYGRDQGQAIAGGAFTNPASNRFPADYAGDYFFADFVTGTIRRIDPTTGVVTNFASGAESPVDLRVGQDGALYYLSRSLGQVLRVDTTSPPAPTLPQPTPDPTPTQPQPPPQPLQTSRLTLVTSTVGLQLVLDGQSVAAPTTFASVVGQVHTLEAPAFQTLGGATYAFVGWSDGGVSSHAVTTPSADAQFQATYRLISARVNFQPAEAPTPSGYEADTGATFGPRSSGLAFGWNVRNSSSARDRNADRSPDQRYDTFQTFRGRASRWEIAVPDGTYSVRVVAGDPIFSGRPIRLRVEETSMIRGRPTRSVRWLDRSIFVSVSDGRLTIQRGPGGLASRINFVEVTRLPK